MWDCDRLVELARGLPRIRVPLSDIVELDEAYWRDDGQPHLTTRELVEHMRLVREADLSYPIILSADGRVMDGMHRAAKALLEGRDTIEAVRFESDPDPDFINVELSELPY